MLELRRKRLYLTLEGEPSMDVSRNQTLMDEVTHLAMSSMKRQRGQDRGGHIAVCQSDMITSLPKNQFAGLAYAETARRDNFGAPLANISRI